MSFINKSQISWTRVKFSFNNTCFYLHLLNLKDTLKVFYDLKNKQKSVWSNAFWYVKVCIFWKCIQYTTHSDKTQMLKKLDKINGTKMAPFSFCELQLILVSLSFYNSYMSWSTRFFSKTACGVLHFDFVSCLLKFVFLFNIGLFDFKTS